jgi:hypothetical protein
VSFDYLDNLRELKNTFFEGWAGVMKRGGTHKCKAQSRDAGEKNGWEPIVYTMCNP